MAMHISSEHDANCSYANVTVYDGAHAVASPVIGEFCGRHKPFHLISTGNDVLVTFRTTVGRYYSGFKIQYEIFNNHPYEIFHESGQQTGLAVSGLSHERCNGTVQMLSEPAGTIVIGPSYEANDTCFWDIRAPSRKCIKLLFGSFSLPNTVADNLIVYDGPNSFSTGEFMFNRMAKPPLSLTSSSDSMFIRFESDSSQNPRYDAIIGFDYMLSDSCEIPKCNGYFAIITKPVGEITSPGFGNGRYFADDTCFWLFRAPKDHIVRMNLAQKSSIAKSNACVDDSLKIFDGPHLGSTIILTACGSYQNDKIIDSTENEILVSFRSGKRQTGEPGFKLSYEFIATKKNCFDPPTIANAAISYSDTTTGSVAKYLCKQGYQFFNNGNGIITCQENGKWTEPIPLCQPIRCPSKLPLLANGYVKHQDPNGNFIFNSSLTYACNPGFIIRGNRIVVCQSDGNWGDLPVCSKAPTCTNPAGIENGDVFFSSTEIGAIASYRCHEYYKLQGPGTISCLADGFWQNPPSCVRAANDCPEPNLIIAHGTATLTGKSPGDVVTYICQDGYKMVGEDTTVCQLSGEWSGASPNCIPEKQPVHCPLPENVENGHYEVTGREAGSMLTFFCNAGFHLKGQRMAFCLATGQWSFKSIPECLAEPNVTICQFSPPPVENGKYIVSSHHVGGTANYSCFEGFELEGPSVATCNVNGTWSTAPICKRKLIKFYVNFQNNDIYRNNSCYPVRRSTRNYEWRF